LGLDPDEREPQRHHDDPATDDVPHRTPHSVMQATATNSTVFNCSARRFT
jgi:hypothetical protein